MIKLKQDLIDLGKKVLNPNNLELVGIDFTKGEDKTVYVTLQNGSVIERTMSYETCEVIRGKRSEILLCLDKAYDKYLRRVKNRQKLYEKLKKLGR